jgi:hypothetical protein
MDDTPPHVEFLTTLRGRSVRCWLEGGQLRGDPELLRRLELFAPAGTELDPVRVAHLVEDAVGSDVVIRLRPPAAAAAST